VTTYHVQDWLNGVRFQENAGRKIFNDLDGVFMRFQTQVKILRAARSRLETSLFDIAQLDALKTAQVLDVPRCRQVQRLADLRNFCGHGKEREPTKEQVNELIDGVESSLLEMLSAGRLPFEPPWSC